MINGLLEIIGSILAIVRSHTDPAKMTSRFNLAIRKNTKKALDTAEDIFELIDGAVLAPDVEKKYKKLKRRFNDYD